MPDAQIQGTILAWRIGAPFRKAYLERYQASASSDWSNFDALSVPAAEIRTRIHSAVGVAIQKVATLLAWQGVTEQIAIFFNFIGWWLGPVTAILAPIFFFPHARAPLEWVVALVLGVVLSRLLIFVWIPALVVGWMPFILTYTVVVLAFVPFFIVRTAQVPFVPSSIWDGIRSGILGGTTSFWSSLAAIGLSLLADRVIDARAARIAPGAMVIVLLLRTLRTLEPWRPGVGSGGYISVAVVPTLERIGGIVERDLARQLAAGTDPPTRKWLGDSMRQIAAAFRDAKHRLILPTADESGVRDLIAKSLALAANGYWGDFERKDAPTPSATAGAWFASFVRKALATVVPVAAIAIVEFAPITLSAAVKDSILSAAAGWLFVTLLSWLDPTGLQERASALKDIIPLLRKAP